MRTRDKILTAAPRSLKANRIPRRTTQETEIPRGNLGEEEKEEGGERTLEVLVDSTLALLRGEVALRPRGMRHHRSREHQVTRRSSVNKIRINSTGGGRRRRRHSSSTGVTRGDRWLTVPGSLPHGVYRLPSKAVECRETREEEEGGEGCRRNGEGVTRIPRP